MVTQLARTAAETLLAFDFGAKRIGVAVGNDFLRQAQALKTIHVDSMAARYTQIGALLIEWRPQRLVVGVPTTLDGSPHPFAARCERFANQLHGRYGLPVARIDERHSSQEADALHRQLRRVGAGRSPANDHLAAQIILQRYFDALEPASPAYAQQQVA